SASAASSCAVLLVRSPPSSAPAGCWSASTVRLSGRSAGPTRPTVDGCPGIATQGLVAADRTHDHARRHIAWLTGRAGAEGGGARVRGSRRRGYRGGALPRGPRARAPPQA